MQAQFRFAISSSYVVPPGNATRPSAFAQPPHPLSGPVVLAALADAGVDPAEVDELMGNASEGGSPARLISLAAGLPGRWRENIDRQCASRLDAIIAAAP